MSSEELKFDFNYEILPENNKTYDLSFKIIILGDSDVGKSCLTQMATKNKFNDSYKTTVGFEFYVFNIKIEEKIIKLQLWDTCGQEIYRSLISNFYRNSSLAIMVYSVTNKASFENIDLWYKELKNNANPNINVFLIGNKIDLEEQRQVTKEDGENYLQQFGFNKFVESSAKSGFNAQNIFIEAAKLLYDEYKKYHDNKTEKDLNSSNKFKRTNSETTLDSGDTSTFLQNSKNKKKEKKEKKNCC